MGRGAAAEVGATRIAPNGYHYTKVDGEPSWRLTHHIKMEEYLRRPLKPGERVHFVDNSAEGKLNFSRENLKLIMQGTASIRKQIARIDARIEDLQRERSYWVQQLPPEAQNSMSASVVD